MEKFTSGEWVVSDDPLDNGYVRCNGSMVARAHSGENIPWTEKTRHNAHLIAAAPDMYAVLKMIQIEGGLSVARHRQIGRALKKARGE